MRVTGPDGFLLLHVWVEEEHPQPLRVVLTAVPELGSTSVEVAATTSADEAVECVRQWLRDFAASTVAPTPEENP